MDLMHVEPVFTGSVWAFIALTRALVLACLPLAAIGLALFALTKRRGIKWASWWFRLFQVGFVIQICSVVLTIVLALILHLFSPYELSGTIWESLLPLIFVGSAVGGSFALAAWRGLMRAVRLEAPPSLVR